MPALGHFAFNRTTHFELHKMEMLQKSIHLQKKAENKLFKQQKHKLFPVMASKESTSFSSSPLSASHTIKEFYTCINEKNLKQLRDYISTDCYIEECSFSTPFQGKMEVVRFFEQLAASMGQNVKFSVKHVCEGDELTAAANWHLGIICLPSPQPKKNTNTNM
ncbi:hypothetical protein FNV43_RR09315 [Rhamnella rubrinervis]|uniref:Nuclear transport factor 2 domain-containing protein n=1 Tax=Rhamnella rubrinervis TaxID=2594499 RepID=A0A8K0H9W0_9ROSA|nr:hypothetical protein FNV43_RR09315 [Rhamnella rubrinervis]